MITYTVDDSPAFLGWRASYVVTMHETGCPDRVVYRSGSKVRAKKEAARLRRDGHTTEPVRTGDL